MSMKSFHPTPAKAASGYSLLEVVVALGLTGGLVLAGGQMATMVQKSLVKTQEHTFTLSTRANIIRSLRHDGVKDFCTEGLQLSSAVAAALDGQAVGVLGPRTSTGTQLPVVRDGEVRDGVQYSLRLERRGASQNVRASSGEIYDAYPSVLVVKGFQGAPGTSTASRMNAAAGTTEVLRYEIPVDVMFGPGGLYKGCSLSKGAESDVPPASPAVTANCLSIRGASIITIAGRLYCRISAAGSGGSNECPVGTIPRLPLPDRRGNVNCDNLETTLGPPTCPAGWTASWQRTTPPYVFRCERSYNYNSPTPVPLDCPSEPEIGIYTNLETSPSCVQRRGCVGTPRSFAGCCLERCGLGRDPVTGNLVQQCTCRDANRYTCTQSCVTRAFDSPCPATPGERDWVAAPPPTGKCMRRLSACPPGWAADEFMTYRSVLVAPDYAYPVRDVRKPQVCRKAYTAPVRMECPAPFRMLSASTESAICY